MHKPITCLILFFLLSVTAIAQPNVTAAPSSVTFNNAFDRLVPVVFINRGNQTALIDSIGYKWYRYFIRFNKYSSFPLQITPGDTLKMDCIYSGFFYASVSDSLDTMKVYVRNVSQSLNVPIKIKLGPDEYDAGTVTGTVTDTNNRIQANAAVYFFYENQGLYDSVFTDANGLYTRILPKGKYLVAAKTGNSYLTWNGSATDPFRSPYITVRRELTAVVPLTVIPQPITQHSARGKIIDSVSIAPLKKGVIVIRKGNHNPDKSGRQPGTETYSALVNRDGSYTVPSVITPGYYFIQAFSDYFVPGYYTTTGKPAPFWQQADSVLISGEGQLKNITVRRDSSIGAGSVSGVLSPYAKFNDAVLYAVSSTGRIYSASFISSSGEFTVGNLPFGRYSLIIQTIYNNDVVSVPFTIDSVVNKITNISILYTGINEQIVTLPGVLSVAPNYPNPFNPSTVIPYSLQVPAEVTIRIYSVSGELLSEHAAGMQSGEQEYVFHGNSKFAGAVLIYEVSAGKVSVRRKMTMLK